MFSLCSFILDLINGYKSLLFGYYSMHKSIAQKAQLRFSVAYITFSCRVWQQTKYQACGTIFVVTMTSSHGGSFPNLDQMSAPASPGSISKHSSRSLDINGSTTSLRYVVTSHDDAACSYEAISPFNSSLSHCGYPAFSDACSTGKTPRLTSWRHD